MHKGIVLKGVFSSNIFPGNPEITNCRAEDAKKGIDIEVKQIGRMAIPKEIDDKLYSYSVGPFACDLCPRNCKDAFAVIRDDKARDLQNTHPDITTTPVELGKHKSESAREMFMPSKERAKLRLPDEEIAVHNQQFVDRFMTQQAISDIGETAIAIAQSSAALLDGENGVVYLLNETEPRLEIAITPRI